MKILLRSSTALMLLFFCSGKLFSQEQEGRFFFSRSMSVDFDKMLSVPGLYGYPIPRSELGPWEPSWHSTWLFSYRIKRRWALSTGFLLYRFSWSQITNYKEYDKYGHYLSSHTYREYYKSYDPGIPLILSYSIPIGKTTSILTEGGLVYFTDFHSQYFILGTKEAIGLQYTEDYIAFTLKANSFYSAGAFPHPDTRYYSIGAELSFRITLGKLKPVKQRS
ncbi:MAG: hypothetical protein JWO09_1365 [Bacteroidetes bacterium]|nr:hypothetical protein [Bacteroidota bacterium]